MAPDKQAQFIARWFTKAEQDTDVFDRFVSAWVALCIASQRHRTIRGQGRRDETERERVIDYFRSNAAKLRAAVQENVVELKRLAERRGTRGGTIVDGDAIQVHSRLFRGTVLETSPCTNEHLATATAEILNKVRNNLFHGAKIYDDTNDRELLSLVTPFLMTFVATCEGLRFSSAT
jgi:hypothetical protein